MKSQSALGTPVERLTRKMFTRIIATLARTLHREDFSVAQIAALYLLDEHGSLRVGQIGAETGRTDPLASRLVDGLVKRGLVARREDTSDRRVRVVALTAKGRAVVARASEERVRTILEATRSMPVAAFAEMLQSNR